MDLFDYLLFSFGLVFVVVMLILAVRFDIGDNKRIYMQRRKS